jgi:hypothetical protein
LWERARDIIGLKKFDTVFGNPKGYGFAKAKQ